MPVVLSGIRPTGALHLGNYFGAVQFFIALQKEAGSCFYFVADLHALTTAVEESLDVDAASMEVVRLYLACGVDPDRALIYRQSDIAEIPFIALLLGMIASEGELRRCTTYKEKVEALSEKDRQISLGLLSYPVLMAADILFCHADIVPVGEDQRQHLEIVREIARRYNFYYAKRLRLTEPQAHRIAPIRVPGLTGAGKMSKSVGGPDSVIYLLDSPGEVTRKIMAAKTDLGPTPGSEMSQPMKNLYTLLQLCAPEAVYREYLALYERGEQKFYGRLKQQLVKDVNALLAPIQQRYHSPACSPERVRHLLAENAARVRPLARQTLERMLADFGVAN